MKVTERLFYTTLIITLTILAILLPVIIIQTGGTLDHYIYVRSVDKNSAQQRSFLTDDLSDKYYTVEELTEYLEDFSKKRSVLFTTQEIERTEGNNPIHEVILRKRNKAKHMALVVSGLSANDWGSVLTSIQIMHRFFSDVRRSSRLLNKFDFHFLPLLNPDGYNFSMSLPIFLTWTKNYEGFSNGKHKGRMILDGYDGEENIPKEVKIFKEYFIKNQHLIKVAFFLFSPPDFCDTTCFTVSKEWAGNGTNKGKLVENITFALQQKNEKNFEYMKIEESYHARIDQWVIKKTLPDPVFVINFLANYRVGPPEIQRMKAKPSALDKPWILSKNGDDPISIPLQVTKLLKNYHIMAIEFLYHNYRKGVKGSILNQEPDMNVPLQLSAFFRALLKGPAIILVVCSRQSNSFWHYHLVNHANFDVIQISSKNVNDSFKGDNRKIALLVNNDSLKLCEELYDHDFFSVVIEDLDQIAIKRVVKRLNGSFNFSDNDSRLQTDPDQKLQWNMLNWANPGCVGKLHEFYEIDNRNFDHFDDNYRFWWLRLTWQFCESFEKPTQEEMVNYQEIIEDWGSANLLSFTEKKEKKTRKRKLVGKVKSLITDVINDTSINYTSTRTISNEVPMDKYVKLPSMDESPIVTSIIKNFEISPEPILKSTSQLPYTQTHSLPYTQTQPHCSTYNDESSVVLSFLEDQDKPSTSRSQSEDFILNLI